MECVTKKIYVTLIITIVCIILFSILNKVSATMSISQFKDIPSNAWYKEEVQYVVEHGLMNGTGNGKFSPDGTVTRAMLVTVLWRAEGSPSPTQNASFTDVPKDSYYYTATSWAKENGIADGVGGGKFAPNNNITREQAATMIGRYLRKYLQTTTTNVNKFKDDTKISSYAKNEVYFLKSNKIIEGTGDNYFNPKNGLKRSELASLICKVTKKVNEYFNIITATVISNNGINIREKPSSDEDSKILKSIIYGTQIEVVQEKDGWLKLRYEAGYVYGANLSFDSETKNYDKTAKVVNVQNGVNVRRLPNTNSKILMVLNAGNIVKVGQTQNGWTQVKVGRIFGYISSEYLETIGSLSTGDWEKICEIKTDNTTTSNNSKYNAQLATQILTGIIIKPQETFSWCKIMGPCSGEKGFTESTTFTATGENVQSFGGGICQISTTINMAIKAISIKTDAVQHSKPVKYASRADEATVSYPSTDFSFTNTKSKPLMIIIKAEKGICICQIFQKK